MLPSKYLKLDRYEKAFIIAAIDMKLEKDKKEADKIKRKRKKR